MRRGLLLAMIACTATPVPVRAPTPKPQPPVPVPLPVPVSETSQPPNLSTSQPPPPPPPPPTTVTRTAPDGSTETCALLTRFPFDPPDLAADPATPRYYTPDDADTITSLCNVDFYAADSTTGVCPKLMWTTPALELYDLSTPPKPTTKDRFESRQCSIYHKRNRPKIAKLKVAVYAKENEAALLYFHFSRLLGGAGFVVPTTARSISRKALVDYAGDAIDRITKHAYTGTPIGGWQTLQHRQKKSKAAVVWGSLAKNPHGEHTFKRFRYYPGTKRPIYHASDFAKQDYARLVASTDPIGPVSLQMIANAQDFTELVILDHLFHQRDRVGNVDARPLHFYLDGGHLRWSKEAPAGKDSVVLERILLKDNDDALVWDQYGRMDTSSLVDDLHHLDPLTYARIQWLAGLMRDDASADLVRSYFVDTVHIQGATYDDIRTRFLDLADRFAQAHADGTLALDLDLAAAIANPPPAEPPRRHHRHRH